MVRLRKGIASRYWEDLVRCGLCATVSSASMSEWDSHRSGTRASQVLAIIGEQFDVGNEICGAVISVRYNEDIISLWNRNADHSDALRTIRCVTHPGGLLRRVLVRAQPNNARDLRSPSLFLCGVATRCRKC